MWIRVVASLLYPLRSQTSGVLRDQGVHARVTEAGVEMQEQTFILILEVSPSLPRGTSLSLPQNDLNEDGVTIVEEQEANPEDMHDYVNNAPWTRNRQRNQPMIIDSKFIMCTSTPCHTLLTCAMIDSFNFSFFALFFL